MRTLGLVSIVVCAALLLVGGCGARPDPPEKPVPTEKPDPRENLDTAIAEGIRLLEAEDYTGFFMTFAPPALIKEMTESGELDDILERFVEGKAAGALEDLKQIKGTTSTLSPDGKEATFRLPSAPWGDTITFIKVGKYWYISN